MTVQYQTHKNRKQSRGERKKSRKEGLWMDTVK